MAGHVDILENGEHLAKPFWGSVLLHISLAVSLLTFGRASFSSSHIPLIGDPHGGGFGAVAVTPTNSIPLPPKSGPVNPVANDTESHVPAPPPKPATKAKEKEPPPNAIPLKSRNATVSKRELARAAAERNKWLEQLKHPENQLYNPGGQALSTPMFNMPGGGGVGVGTNSPFGTQFGWYATLIRDKVARAWHTTDLDSRAQPVVVVTFTIRRDGSLAPGSAQIAQSSGNRAIDFSAQRAVLDAAPFPALPPGFPRTEAAVELRFELRR